MNSELCPGCCSKEVDNKPRRICILSTMYLRYEDDTRGLMVSEYARNLINSGFEVHVVAPNDGAPKYEVMKGVHVHRFNYFIPRLQRLAYGAGIPTNLRISKLAKLQVPFFGLAFLWKAFRVARKCDVIHAQWVPSGFVGAILKKILKKKLLITVRAIPWSKGLKKHISKFALKTADHVFGNSSFTLRKAMEVTDLKSCSVYHNSVNLNKFTPGSNRNETELRKFYGIRDDEFLLFTMGLLVEKKGFEYLIEAYKILKQLDDRYRLIIGGSGPREDILKQFAKGTDIVFAGKIDADMTPMHYRACDLFVLPSIVDSKGETETLGVVLLEAMACGKACVASRVGGIPDVVKNEETGLLVHPKDEHSLVMAITYLRNNLGYRLICGNNGRKRVERMFGWRKDVERFYE